MKKAHARFAIKRLYSERLKNMVVYKCKECGGEIEPQENGLGKCLYCGAVQTLPKEKDDKIQNLLNRANDFRLNCDFDRAIFEYEEVLKLSESEPEAHWGLFLSKYGVEYVKDNMTFTYKPTLHRISSVSVFDDVDYQATIKYADSISATQYKKDAENIETVMKELLLLSANQKPYDVFLSYKELDDTTRQRTDDSYLAHDLYNELTAQGYKVFFAPKSLGVGLYEPKIYSAIISSKVMIVLGTQVKYFDAVWVKNEWSRFAELIDNGEQKVLVPVFKNMEAGQLPNRLAKYQAYDMANISFLPSLLNVISQYVNKQSQVKFNKDASAEEAYLERGFLALEDKNFSQAESFFENVLNLNPHNSQAYFGKLMVEMRISKQEQILTSSIPLKEYANFEKAVRFADQQLKTTLLQYEGSVKNTIDEQKRIAKEKARLEQQKKVEQEYKNLKQNKFYAKTNEDWLELYNKFSLMKSIENAQIDAYECLNNLTFNNCEELENIAKHYKDLDYAPSQKMCERCLNAVNQWSVYNKKAAYYDIDIYPFSLELIFDYGGVFVFIGLITLLWGFIIGAGIVLLEFIVRLFVVGAKKNSKNYKQFKKEYKEFLKEEIENLKQRT